KAANSGVVVTPYPRIVHFSSPAGYSRCANLAAMRGSSSSNPATSAANESTIVRLNHCSADGVTFDSSYSCANLTILAVVSSIGPLSPRRLKLFTYPGPVKGAISPGARIEPGAGPCDPTFAPPP